MICFTFSVNLAPWRFLPWSPWLYLKLHGNPLALFSVNLAPLTFSSLEPLLALETAWRISRPFLRQFGAPDVFFPGAPACTWNCIASLSPFSPSIWRPWRFLPWSPCLHLKLHGVSLVLFSVNLAPLTFSSLEPLLALETAWRPSRPFLRQFGAPDVFFPGAPACTENCMAPLSSFSPSIWRSWCFLPWSPCLRLKLHGAPLVLFSVNLVPLTFSFLEPLLALKTAWRLSRPFLRQFGAPDVFFPGAPACTSLELLLALETAWRPSRHIDITFFLSFFFHAPSFFPFFFLIPFFSSFLPSLFLSLSFFLSFWRPFGDPGGPGPPKPPPKIRPWERKHCASGFLSFLDLASNLFLRVLPFVREIISRRYYITKVITLSRDFFFFFFMYSNGNLRWSRRNNPQFGGTTLGLRKWLLQWLSLL